MEVQGKEYSTRSKSGVRKTRTPWDNSTNFLLEELAAVKRSPKQSPSARKKKDGASESPKSANKKTKIKSPLAQSLSQQNTPPLKVEVERGGERGRGYFGRGVRGAKSMDENFYGGPLVWAELALINLQ